VVKEWGHQLQWVPSGWLRGWGVKSNPPLFLKNPAPKSERSIAQTAILQIEKFIRHHDENVRSSFVTVMERPDFIPHSDENGSDL
jgi:hypothetical protein